MTNPDVTRWRKARGWTQPQAAAAFGIHPRSWAKWEYGERPVPPIARKLMDALDSINRLEMICEIESEDHAKPEGRSTSESEAITATALYKVRWCSHVRNLRETV